MNTAPDLLIAASQLPALSPALVLDARDRAAYDAGHWPGAVHLDIKQWEHLARTEVGHLDRLDVWASQIGALGIDGRVPVIAYDDGRMTEAARAWFILQWHGVDVKVLDGGWPAFNRLPNFVPERQAQHPAQVCYVRPTAHEPLVQLIRRETLLEKLGTEVQILDARTQAEHFGEDLRSNARGGHLPGAKWVPHAELLHSDGTLKRSDDLRARLQQAGVDSDAPVVTHCDAGGRAALSALAAVVAGQRDVYAYYLSFSDWAADGSCPIVKPGGD